jgi:uncharacterized protein YacL
MAINSVIKKLSPIEIVATLLGGVIGLLIGIPAGVAAGANFGFLVIVLFVTLGFTVGYRQRKNRLFFYFSLFTFLILTSTLYRVAI